MLLDLHPAYNALWGAASAALSVQAASAVALSLDATGAGALPVQAASSAGLSLAAEVTGPMPVRAEAAGALALSGTAGASLPVQATALVSLDLAGVAAGTLPVQGEATAAISLGATVVGRVPVSASGAGGLSLAGVVVCRVPVTCALAARYVVPEVVRTSLAQASTRTRFAHATTPTALAHATTPTALTHATTLTALAHSGRRTRLTMTSLIRVYGDSADAYNATLTSDGAAYNLTGAQSVTLRCRHRQTGVVTALPLTVVSATAGTVKRDWASSDLAVGVYDVRIRVIDANGDQQTFPNNSNAESLTILEAP